jgi:hypothetical protein
MSKTKRTYIFSTIIVSLLLFSNFLVYPYVVANYTDNAYNTNNENKRSVPLNSYIVYSASNMLNSYSDVLIFLNKFELSELRGVDFDELGEIINRAIDNLEKAKEYYVLINLHTNSLCYDYNILNCLKFFDYSSFQKEKGLNSSVFCLVESYLKDGNVSGIFASLLSDSENILNKLYAISNMVSSKNLPNVELLWRLNQNLSETMLFGQYTSEILHYIINNK